MHFTKLAWYKTITPVVLICCIFFIFSGSEWLLWRVSFLFGFHIGTIVAWIGLVACSLIATKLNKTIRLMRILSSISFYISIFWLLLSFVFAGNNNLIFTNETHYQRIYWLIITILPLFIFIVSVFLALISKIIKLRKAKPD